MTMHIVALSFIVQARVNHRRVALDVRRNRLEVESKRGGTIILA
jgi:hypothetical protein